MSVKIECDRCGAQEQTSGVLLFAGLTGPAIPTARPGLPDGWTRPTLPEPDGSKWERELCPDCTADLIRLMAGAVLAPDEADEQMERPDQICPDCGHLRHSDPCPDEVSEVGPCGCRTLTPRSKMERLGIDD